MPQPFNNAVMTKAGAALLTRAQAGEVKIEFTRMAIGNGVYTAEEKTLDSLQSLTALKALKNSYTFESVSAYSEYSVKLTAFITNYDFITQELLVTDGYYINEIGLFAKIQDEDDSTEILYSIAVTSGENGDFMPPYNGYNIVQITQDYFVTVSNSAEVTIISNGAVATISDINNLQEQIDAVKQDIIQQASITKAVLAAGATSVTIEDDRITTDSALSFYTSIFGVNPTAASIDTGSVTLTFKAQTEDMEVGVRVDG